MGSGTGGMSKICEHCGCDIAIRNPSGYCDHLRYPESCKICNKSETREEEFVRIISKLVVDNSEGLVIGEDVDLVMHEGKAFRIRVEEVKG